MKASDLPCPAEHVEQSNLFEWIRIMEQQSPLYRLFYAIPNGGDRVSKVGAKLKREGVKRGVPDIAAPIARGGYFGIYIEMKRVRGSTFPETQKWWRDQLQAQGYYWRLCKGYRAAELVITEYMSWEQTIVVGK